MVIEKHATFALHGEIVETDGMVIGKYEDCRLTAIQPVLLGGKSGMLMFNLIGQTKQISNAGFYIRADKLDDLIVSLTKIKEQLAVQTKESPNA